MNLLNNCPKNEMQIKCISIKRVETMLVLSVESICRRMAVIKRRRSSQISTVQVGRLILELGLVNLNFGFFLWIRSRNILVYSLVDVFLLLPSCKFNIHYITTFCANMFPSPYLRIYFFAKAKKQPQVSVKNFFNNIIWHFHVYLHQSVLFTPASAVPH